MSVQWSTKSFAGKSGSYCKETWLEINWEIAASGDWLSVHDKLIQNLNSDIADVGQFH